MAKRNSRNRGLSDKGGMAYVKGMAKLVPATMKVLISWFFLFSMLISFCAAPACPPQQQHSSHNAEVIQERRRRQMGGGGRSSLFHAIASLLGSSCSQHYRLRRDGKISGSTGGHVDGHVKLMMESEEQEGTGKPLQGSFSAGAGLIHCTTHHRGLRWPQGRHCRLPTRQARTHGKGHKVLTRTRYLGRNHVRWQRAPRQHACTGYRHLPLHARALHTGIYPRWQPRRIHADPAARTLAGHMCAFPRMRPDIYC